MGVHALVLCCLLAASAGAQEADSATTTAVEEGEVEVQFAGDEEVELKEGEEIVEEMEWEDVEAPPPLPEYDERPWLVALPLLLVALVGWNVRWRSGPRRHQTKRKKS